MSKKLNFGFDVSDVPEFVNQNTDLMLQMIAENTTIGVVTNIMDQQGSFTLNTLNSSIYVQLDACGWNPSGQTTTFGSETVVLKNLKTDESLCAKDLRSKYVSQLYKIGSDGSTLPFEQFIVENKSKLLAKTVEQLHWIGSTANGVGNMSMVDGVLEYLNDKGSVYVASATGVTSATIIAKIDLLINALPVEAYQQPDVKLFIDPALFRMYISALKTSGLYQGTAFEMKPYGQTVMIDGHNIEIISNNAFTNTGYMVLTPASNVVFGTDVISDTTNIKISYYEREESYDVKGRWAQGSGVYFPQYVIHNVSTISI